MAAKSKPGRRQFLGTAAGAGVGLVAAPRLATGVLGANERVTMGIIGSGGMGRGHMGNFKRKSVRWAAVCDVYEPHRNQGLRIAKQQSAPDLVVLPIQAPQNVGTGSTAQVSR